MLVVENSNDLEGYLKSGNRQAVCLYGLQVSEMAIFINSVSPQVLRDTLLINCSSYIAHQARLDHAGVTQVTFRVDDEFLAVPRDLYTPLQLHSGIRTSYNESLDARVHAWNTNTQVHSERRDIPRFVHDHVLQSHLEDHVAGATIVAVLGGHSLERRSPFYRHAAHLSRMLALRGINVVTEGGPGAMEAANLGASACHLGEEALDAVLEELELGHANSSDNTELYQSAAGVRDKYAMQFSQTSFAVSLWSNIYGHDPANVFAASHGRFLTSFPRPGGPLGFANKALVFFPGSAGTVQEIFEAVTPQYYGISSMPIVLFGSEYWTKRLDIMSFLRSLTSNNCLYDRIHLLDSCESACDVIVRSGSQS